MKSAPDIFLKPGAWARFHFGRIVSFLKEQGRIQLYLLAASWPSMTLLIASFFGWLAILQRVGINGLHNPIILYPLLFVWVIVLNRTYSGLESRFPLLERIRYTGDIPRASWMPTWKQPHADEVDEYQNK